MSAVGSMASPIAIGFVFPILGGILVGSRFYIRYHQNVDFAYDDWMSLGAWICTTCSCASLLAGVFKMAFGMEPVSLPEMVTEQERILAHVTGSLDIFWIAAIFLTKLTIMTLYRRIFIGKIFIICSNALIGLTIVWFLFAVSSWLFYCGLHLKQNFEGGWLVCPLWGFEIQFGVFVLNSVIDLCILVLPVRSVSMLQMKTQKKIHLLVVFLLGGFSFVAGIINTVVQIVYLTNDSRVASGSNRHLYQGSSLLFSNWPAIEIGVGLITCNLPSAFQEMNHTISKLFRRMFTIPWAKVDAAAAVVPLRSNAAADGVWVDIPLDDLDSRGRGRGGEVQRS
ncbi:hypothetical protein GLAREA_12050 [Glarea lozoyensis ATCC 20868]|uniref:Rhodopsin domain-containing protein n=1 Tax=Glarea lozoyensis (strain ATCC 20868 / MF5171) TaxID=1116229 RepID=S3E098_GLAL2|nr:uncharacterized protein GLAREA_12050 [Glarea lozoyensis ATCC 20868]EPE31968.1 hypothetical protein GLAREA_12050 [Glarea lozoyensis ATCC 20868]